MFRLRINEKISNEPIFWQFSNWNTAFFCISIIKFLIIPCFGFQSVWDQLEEYCLKINQTSVDTNLEMLKEIKILFFLKWLLSLFF